MTRTTRLITGIPGERGSSAVEAAIIAPALIMLILLVVLAGRVTSAKMRVEEAARDAARAASLASDSSAASAAASSTAQASLSSAGITCQSFSVTSFSWDFSPGVGGKASVTVQCTTPLSDLAPLPVPGSKTLSGSFQVPIDPFRSQ